ncbi:unnamed protein product [Microthlaspi erraticum]|uniref:Uncharacterized protein n=1 Tax=Microthlaspi erraticum TaxID=1685480 RepID=A0A6D2HEC9_9BRAS|nr:unnamed protein product [Microthlaspi erraticum]
MYMYPNHFFKTTDGHKYRDMHYRSTETLQQLVPVSYRFSIANHPSDPENRYVTVRRYKLVYGEKFLVHYREEFKHLVINEQEAQPRIPFEPEVLFD